MKLFLSSIAAALVAASFASAQQPVIKAVVPETAAAGSGQLVTVQGFGLQLANNPVAKFQPALGGATITCSFNIPVVSNANELYLRLSVVNNCQLPVGSYIMRVESSQGASPGYAFDVKLNPATPIVRSITNPSLLPITQAKAGDSIIVFGYGIDLTGAKVVFSQGFSSVTVNATGIAAASGVGAKVTVPAGFTNGTVLVQLEARVGPLTNSPSNAQKLQIVP
jgi:hypothetical protein